MLTCDTFPEDKKLTPQEVFNEELKKIRECTEWYKLADYLHFDIDLPRPTTESDSAPFIRILPMSSKEEFPGMSIEDVQDYFFLEKLIERDGIYYFRKVGMNTPGGSLILFQFYIDTVKVFQPITLAEITRIDSNITRFSQSKQEIYSSFMSEIDEEYEVDPKNDLQPVCPNCHLALHSKVGDQPYGIEELKGKINRTKSLYRLRK